VLFSYLASPCAPGSHGATPSQSSTPHAAYHKVFRFLFPLLLRFFQGSFFAWLSDFFVVITKIISRLPRAAVQDVSCRSIPLFSYPVSYCVRPTSAGLGRCHIPFPAPILFAVTVARGLRPPSPPPLGTSSSLFPSCSQTVIDPEVCRHRPVLWSIDCEETYRPSPMWIFFKIVFFLIVFPGGLELDLCTSPLFPLP